MTKPTLVRIRSKSFDGDRVILSLIELETKKIIKLDHSKYRLVGEKKEAHKRARKAIRELGLTLVNKGGLTAKEVRAETAAKKARSIKRKKVRLISRTRHCL